MNHVSRLAVAGAAVFAGTVGSWAFALPASASTGANPVPVTASAPASLPTSASGDVTGEESKKKKKADPCTGDAALDSESGTWRATVSCDGWTAVLPGSYSTEQAARDEAEGWANGVNKHRFVDGPGCDEPFVLC
jgi:hypothetical protein